MITRHKSQSRTFSRRQKEAEQKNIAVEANKRIEELVAQRVEQELERRREEIEAEVLRRVEEAKKVMEAQMLKEMERKRQEQIEEQKKREVKTFGRCLSRDTFSVSERGKGEGGREKRTTPSRSIERSRTLASAPASATLLSPYPRRESLEMMELCLYRRAVDRRWRPLCCG